MRYGIPIIGNRVAPRCIYADSVLVVALQRNKAKRENLVILAHHSMVSLVDILLEYRVDTLICGGISHESRKYLDSHDVTVIDNVVGTVEELVTAIRTGNLRSGFGLECQSAGDSKELISNGIEESDKQTDISTDSSVDEAATEILEREDDCLACSDQVCKRGKACHLSKSILNRPVLDQETTRMLEASLDISSERERTLCRLSELIYFCLEMRYRRIGVAFCEDLREPAEILVRVLRRFFVVFPVSCKVGGYPDPAISTAEQFP
ncbi:MAG: NifB/NifX family molybdenum-iron cluster-binding protein, partial [Candidatus Zixiibacteriota bacterium]